MNRNHSPIIRMRSQDWRWSILHISHFRPRMQANSQSSSATRFQAMLNHPSQIPTCPQFDNHDILCTLTSQQHARLPCLRDVLASIHCEHHLLSTWSSLNSHWRTQHLALQPTNWTVGCPPDTRRKSRCRHLNCPSYARNGGRCVRHGGGRKCSVVHCLTPCQTGGMCRVHGGGSRCKSAGCDRFARVRGYCSKHVDNRPRSETHDFDSCKAPSN
jgi:hypothetical protein